MIITDFSKTAYACTFALKDDIKVSSPAEIENILRHAIINSFMTTKKRFHGEYGDMIIGLDGKNNHRYDIFSNYKYSRKKNRENDGMPWHIIFNCFEKITEEAKEFFPWKVVWADRAETDDVMAVLVEDVANQNFTQVGMNMEPEKVLLDTRDGDMFQLLKYSNVKQWSSVERKFIGPKESVEEFTKMLLIKGDADSDGVPNVFSDKDCLANGIRQTAAIASRLKPLLEHKNIWDYKDDPKIVERLKENYRLCIFDGMPLDVRDDILESWNTRKKNSKLKMMRYLGDKKCRQLLECIEEM